MLYNPDIIGKSKFVTSRGWKEVATTIENIYQYNYINGYAITVGEYSNQQRTRANWQGAKMLMIDIDNVPYKAVQYAKKRNKSFTEYLANVSFIREYCSLITPSSGYTHEAPKLHLWFMLQYPIETEPGIKLLYNYVASKLPLKIDAQATLLTQIPFGTVFYKPSFVSYNKHNDVDCIVYRNDSAKPLDTFNITIQQHKQMQSGAVSFFQRSINNTDDKIISVRTEKHMQQSHDKQVEIVLSALDVLLANWGWRDYSDWLAMWLSSYAGSNGDSRVRDFILSHEGITGWTDVDKRFFREQWDRHKTKPDGYTVATLFYFAQHEGWLSKTSTELDTYETINTNDITSYLQDIDNTFDILLLKSQTGTGKTRGAIEYIKSKHIDVNNKVLFLAPSIKLCEDLSHTLTSMGVENTLYIDNGTIKSHNELKEAKVLVSTLQSLANKVYKNDKDIKSFQYVIIDESDTLISSFVRSGVTGTLSIASHVKQNEARKGLQALYRLMQSATVLLLDATMTQVSQLAVNKLAASRRIKTVVNTFTRAKAPVKILQNADDAKSLMIKSLAEQKRTVVVCDTKAQASILYKLALYLGAVSEKDSILITSYTAHETKVKAFFKDVEAGADQYKFVVYNSSMGSGVSITNTIADTLIQICTYLTPSDNLQALNRYRQQGDVYVYIQNNESLYSNTYEDALNKIQDVVLYESRISGLHYTNRNDLARYTAELARLAVTGIVEETLSPLLRYKYLLEVDHRQVTFVNPLDVSDNIIQAYKDVKTLLKEQKQLIYRTWYDSKPIDEIDDYSDYSDVEIAQAKIHQRVKDVITDYESYLEANKCKPEYQEFLAELVQKNAKYTKKLYLYHNPDKVYNYFSNGFLESSVPITSFQLQLAQYSLIHLVSHMFKTSDTLLSHYDLENDLESIRAFIRNVYSQSTLYGVVIRNGRYSLDHLQYEHGNDVIALAIDLCKAILKQVGLNVKRRGGRQIEGKRDTVYYISNADNLLTLYNMQHKTDLKFIDFRESAFIDVLHINANRIAGMSLEEQKRILSELSDVVTLQDVERLMQSV